MRKEQTIDVLKLYSQGNHQRWNAWLSGCLKRHDLLSLRQVLYGIQAGMTDLAKSKLDDEKVRLFFLRLQSSIEKTAKKIIREKNPNPCDNSLEAKNFAFALSAKRKRDQELEDFLRKESF